MGFIRIWKRRKIKIRGILSECFGKYIQRSKRAPELISFISTLFPLRVRREYTAGQVFLLYSFSFALEWCLYRIRHSPDVFFAPVFTPLFRLFLLYNPLNRFDKMKRADERVAKKYSRSRVTHYRADFFAHIRLIAMARALRAEIFIVSPPAVIEPV